MTAHGIEFTILPGGRGTGHSITSGTRYRACSTICVRTAGRGPKWSCFRYALRWLQRITCKRACAMVGSPRSTRTPSTYSRSEWQLELRYSSAEMTIYPLRMPQHSVRLIRLRQRLQLPLVELQAQRRHGILQMLHLAGAHYRRGHPGLLQDPRQRH